MQAGCSVSRRGNGVASVGLLVALSSVGQNPLRLVSTVGLGDIPGIDPDFTLG